MIPSIDLFVSVCTIVSVETGQCSKTETGLMAPQTQIWNDARKGMLMYYLRHVRSFYHLLLPLVIDLLTLGVPWADSNIESTTKSSNIEFNNRIKG